MRTRAERSKGLSNWLSRDNPDSVFAHSPSILRWVGPALLIVGVLSNWLASRRQGGDFGYLYIAACALISGGPLYDPTWQRLAFDAKIGGTPPQGVFYPPSTGFAALPFGVLPYRGAQFIWFLILILALGFGIRAIVKLAMPNARSGTWELLAGVIMMSSCVRWGMTPLQGAPLVLGLLAIFVAAIHTSRWQWVFLIAAYVTAFKFTIALPFLGLLLLHRRYLALAGSVAIGAVSNILGFMRMGGLSALAGYRAGIAGLEAPHLINTPDPWDPQSSPRLDWIYLVDGITGNVPVSRIAALIGSAVLALWLLREGLRSERPVSLELTSAFLMPLVCLSVLCLYHHHYDISVAVVPFLLFSMLGEPFQRHPVASLMMVPLGLMMAFLPVAITQRFLLGALGEHGAGWMNIAFPVATTAALLGSLVLLRDTVRRTRLAPE